MNDRRTPESRPQRIIPLGEGEHVLEIRFEERLMEAMGVGMHDNDGARAWVERYAAFYRALVDGNAELRALIAADPVSAVEEIRRRLAPSETEKRTA